jgi:D-alanine-D-alanine ligase
MRIALTYSQQRSAGEAEAEFDSAQTICAIADALAPHDVVPVDVRCSVPALVARLHKCSPDLVLNLAEGERGAFREAFYPALFEQLGLAYTGSSPSVLALCLDKALANRVVAAAGVRVPEQGSDPPWIVKPNFEGSSKGITQASVITDREALPAAIAACRARYPEGVLVEQYIDGIDVAVGLVEPLGLLAPIAYAYEPTGPHRIYDFALKQAPDRVRPHVIDAPAVTEAAARVFAALGVTGYGRADFRLAPSGEVTFVDMNPLPTLADDDLYVASGLSRPELLAYLVAGATPRQRTGSARSPARRAAASRSAPPRTPQAGPPGPRVRGARSYARRRSHPRSRSAAPS